MTPWSFYTHGANKLTLSESIPELDLLQVNLDLVVVEGSCLSESLFDVMAEQGNLGLELTTAAGSLVVLMLS